MNVKSVEQITPTKVLRTRSNVSSFEMIPSFANNVGFSIRLADIISLHFVLIPIGLGSSSNLAEVGHLIC
jgi:hypothetical protein